MTAPARDQPATGADAEPQRRLVGHALDYLRDHLPSGRRDKARNQARNQARDLQPAALDPPGQAPALVFDGQVQTTSAGTRVVRARQEWQGVPFHGASLAVHVDVGGRVLRAVGEARHSPPDVDTAPALGVQRAVLAAALHVADMAAALPTLDGPPLRVSRRQPRLTARFPHPSRPTVLRKPPFRDPVTARLVLVGAEPRLAWEVHLRLPGAGAEWNVLVAADAREPRGGVEVLGTTRTAAHAVFGLVYDFSPGEGPRERRPLPRPRGEHPPLAGRVLPGDHGVWARDGRTRGNNVACFRDNSSQGLAATASGADLLFAPADDQGTDQRLLNAFYLTNFLHDFFFLLGFDEAAGNFQARNFSGAGEDDDDLVVRVFDQELAGVASMRSRRDGAHPELSLGRRGGRHAALDAELVIHEYVHGVTNRIVGGHHDFDPLRGLPQPEAMAEGYSDYFALTLQNFYRRRAGRPERAAYAAWLADDPLRGLRRFAYGAGFPGQYTTAWLSAAPAAHDAGQLWCQALLGVNRALAADRDRGDELGWLMVMDSLKLLRVGDDAPTLLDGRDAVLQAIDAAAAAGTLGGAAAGARAAAARAFTALGMGPGARSPSAKYAGIVPDFGGA